MSTDDAQFHHIAAIRTVINTQAGHFAANALDTQASHLFAANALSGGTR